jgi:hypothetical protein
LVFAVLSVLVILQGATFIYAYLAALNWTQILFTTSLIFIVIAALLFTNKWVVLGNKSPIISVWLDLKQFISKITWDLAKRVLIWTLVGIYIIQLVIGCFVIHSKVIQYDNNIRLSSQWHTMYINKSKDYNDLKEMFDEQSIDYADLHNTVKKRLATGGRGNF